MHFSIDKRMYEKAYENKAALRKEVRNNFSIQNNDIVLSVVGKLVHWKNQQDIIKAMQLLEGSGTVYHLLIIGSGPMLEEWQQMAASLVSNKVHFAGFVKPGELPGYYAATDIYVHPAAIEPHSLSISEAIYMGCPVIISDRCGSYGPADDVQESKNGFVYKFGDIRDLAQKIKWLTMHPAERTAFAAYSHNTGVSFQAQSHQQVLYDLVKQLN
jgi:glycosyltransferase involved in cell wall biosynthesis